MWTVQLWVINDRGKAEGTVTCLRTWRKQVGSKPSSVTMCHRRTFTNALKKALRKTKSSAADITVLRKHPRVKTFQSLPRMITISTAKNKCILYLTFKGKESSAPWVVYRKASFRQWDGEEMCSHLWGRSQFCLLSTGPLQAPSRMRVSFLLCRSPLTSLFEIFTKFGLLRIGIKHSKSLQPNYGRLNTIGEKQFPRKTG